MIKLIAELCQNHQGNEELLFQMAKGAYDSGADYIKIQHIYVENLVYRPRFENIDKSPLNQPKSITRPFASEYDRLSKLELKDSTVKRFVNYVISLGAKPLTTCFSIDSIDKILAQGFRSIKVASYDATSYPMIDLLLSNFDEVFISLGSLFLSEVEYTLKRYKNNPKVTFLHAVTVYPTPIEKSKLWIFDYYLERLPRIGFSDHSPVLSNPVEATMIAIIKGATLIERHFTLLETDETKDGPVSIKPKQLEYIKTFSNMSLKCKLIELESIFPKWEEFTKFDQYLELSQEEVINRDYYKGRFASTRVKKSNHFLHMRFNWEES